MLTHYTIMINCKGIGRKLRLLPILLVFFVVMSVQANDVVKISANKLYESGYWEELLTAALEITENEFGSYKIVIYEHSLGNERHKQEMLKGDLINTRVGISTPEREAAYIAIKIPLRKGLLNYRVLLARKSELSNFAGVGTIGQLKQLKVGLVDRWITSDIFEYHDFDLTRILDYEGLIRTLAAKRYDYTVRGVNEAYIELASAQLNGTELVVVPNIGLYINAPSYFFVSKRHARIAERIEKGFEMMLKNGQFDQIFYKWHQDSIDKADLKRRKFITIHNPFLPANTPTERPELWFQTLPSL